MTCEFEAQGMRCTVDATVEADIRIGAKLRCVDLCDDHAARMLDAVGAAAAKDRCDMSTGHHVSPHRGCILR